MFYLSGRGNVSKNSKTDDEDEFGWYLGDREIIEEKIYSNSPEDSRSPKRVNGLNKIVKKSALEGTSSLPSGISIFACNDCSEKSAGFSTPRGFKKRENGANDLSVVEQIEMNPIDKRSSNDNQEIDLDMIEEDADRGVFTSSIISTKESENLDEFENESVHNDPRGICYTPERLVRSQEYRILTPSPRYLTIPRSIANDLDETHRRNYRGHRRKIGDLIDAKQCGASHLEALLDSGAPEIRVPIVNRRRLNRDRLVIKKNLDAESFAQMCELLEIANRESPITFQTPDLVSSRSSYERLDSSSEERSKIIRGSSQEDTSGIHSNDWSTDTTSDVRTPICLCDELAKASRSFGNLIETKNRKNTINEVVSILEGLERDPERAATLLEEDRFSVFTSGHDNLTRLALAIEPDGPVPTVNGDPEHLVNELREKIERLQETTRNILQDINVIRQDFQSNENKVDDLMDATMTLRRDTSEMRYLDDLLNLLDGELERISRRNWPFVFGHSEQGAEDMNLVV